MKIDLESFPEGIDPQIDHDATEAWRGEIELRLRQIDSGVVTMMPWDDARRLLRGRLQH